MTPLIWLTPIDLTPPYSLTYAICHVISKMPLHEEYACQSTYNLVIMSSIGVTMKLTDDPGCLSFVERSIENDEPTAGHFGFSKTCSRVCKRHGGIRFFHGCTIWSPDWTRTAGPRRYPLECDCTLGGQDRDRGHNNNKHDFI